MNRSLSTKGFQINNSILGNALFLLVLLFIGKVDPMAIVFAYVFETLIIGLLHVVKLFFVVRYNDPEKNSTKVLDYLSIPFFFLHYGVFVVFQSVILYTAFAIKDNRFSTSLNLSNFQDVFNLEGFNLVALSIIISHLGSFYFTFFKTKKFENQNLGTYMIKPYLRIFIQQFLAIVPFFFLIFMNSVGFVAAVMLIVMRSLLDFYLIKMAKNPEAIHKLAKRIMDKNKPDELPKIVASLKVFFEE